MACGRYHELLSARLDGLLTAEEERRLEEHLALCPDCRAVGSRLAAIRTAFDDLEEVPAPEGFAQGVMDRIRRETAPRAIPLFRRPQVRALAGLAACLVLAVGLYSAGGHGGQERWEMAARSFDQGASTEVLDGVTGEDGPRVDASLIDPTPADAPQIAAYAASGAARTDGAGGTMEKAAPVEERYFAGVGVSGAEAALVLDRLPDGAAELIPPETAAQPYPGGGTVYLGLSADVLDQVGRLAAEQGAVLQDLSAGNGAEEPLALIVLEG